MAIYTSILTGGSNNHETTAEYANGTQTDLIGEGVVGAKTNTAGVAPATGAFAANAQGTPAMAVDVSAGIAYVTATPSGQNSQNLRIRSTATEEVTIDANSSGSTKYDWIYLSVSAANAANPAVNADNVATLVTSRSTSISSDDGTPPTYGLVLAKVTVANGASSITNANITDARVSISLPDDSVDTTQLVDEAVTADKMDTTVTWWEEIGRTTLGSAGDTISVASLPARKYLQLRIHLLDTGGTIDGSLRFNNDSGNNYALVRTNINASGTSGGAAATSSSSTSLTQQTAATERMIIVDIVNNATTEKTGFSLETDLGAAGAGNAPLSRWTNIKWANTSDAINRVDIINAGTGNYAIGSEVIVLGHD